MLQFKANTKDKLYKLCADYTDISFKHTTDIGKTNLAQMAHILKDNIKPLDQTQHILPLQHHLFY